jgi:hypothetical protein
MPVADYERLSGPMSVRSILKPFATDYRLEATALETGLVAVGVLAGELEALPAPHFAVFCRQ